MTAVPDPDPDTESETPADSTPKPESESESESESQPKSGLDTDTRQPSPDDRTRTRTQSRTRILPFESQGTAYCIDTQRVSRVLGVTLDGSLQAATDPWYAGEVSFESQWKQTDADSETRQVRVVDLARVLSSPTAPLERPSDAKLLVFETTDDDERHYGWLVDDVDVTAAVGEEELVPTRTSHQFVTGRIDYDGTTLVWLDDRALND
ncbi:chemotaxis protein CheW [Halobacteria archaeon AArc-m2/3/4]|uniref:Chemotaxis protein CheW n=1 Tax=Natronoglomus mannanivorans TaxID=2979990 RepID=A0ABT2QA54_9EURY|nr:chemotaxis protein CheW [Halobacteria archaeon AArc-m2/3/4]